jgi:hypothetical protein
VDPLLQARFPLTLFFRAVRGVQLARLPSPPLSEKTRALCGERFIVLLGDVATLAPLRQGKESRQGQSANRAEGSREEKRKREEGEEEGEGEGEEEGEKGESEERRNPFYNGTSCVIVSVWKIPK